MDWISQANTFDLEMTGYDQEMNKLNTKLSFGKQNPDHNRQLRYSSNESLKFHGNVQKTCGIRCVLPLLILVGTIWKPRDSQ